MLLSHIVVRSGDWVFSELSHLLQLKITTETFVMKFVRICSHRTVNFLQHILGSFTFWQRASKQRSYQDSYGFGRCHTQL